MVGRMLRCMLRRMRWLDVHPAKALAWRLLSAFPGPSCSEGQPYRAGRAHVHQARARAWPLAPHARARQALLNAARAARPLRLKSNPASRLSFVALRTRAPHAERVVVACHIRLHQLLLESHPRSRRLHSEARVKTIDATSDASDACRVGRLRASYDRGIYAEYLIRSIFGKLSSSEIGSHCPPFAYANAMYSCSAWHDCKATAVFVPSRLRKARVTLGKCGGRSCVGISSELKVLKVQ